MGLLQIVLLSVLALTAGILLHYFFSLRGSLRSLKSEIAELKGMLGMPAAEAATAPWIRMIVEVKDPLALAQRESALAKVAAPTAPHLVTKKVYEQVVAQTREQLKSRNVDAEVSLIVL